jgi:hypothetical protein
MKKRTRSSQSGVALITTIIVVAVLAVVAVAFMQSTSTDRLSSRTVANYYRAQLAARAGLAEAMALIQQGTQDFTYVSGSEPQGNTYRTFLRSVSGDSGTWEFNGEKIYLDSGAGDGASILLTGTLAEPGLRRGAAWKTIPLENPRPNETKQFAFWVDDAGGKQNLTWWGGGGVRGLATNLADLRLTLPSPNGVEAGPFPAAALTALADSRSYAPSSFRLADRRFDSQTATIRLPTVSSLNLLAPGVPEGSLERYFFTMSSASGAVTPSGGPKLNLAALRRHINNLNTDQGPDSPRALLVEELLNENPEGEQNWGGGSLAWLAKSEKYTTEEQKQIVANIIDYLDDDLIPTMDNTNAPTFFGVEFKLEDGNVRGHPFVNFVGLGSVYNWKTNNPELGRLNSTRILGFVGLVNPWSSKIPSDAYEVKASVEITGEVTGGTLGTLPSLYFERELAPPPDGPAPPREIDAKTGTTFPGPARGNNYANMKSFFEAGAPQPPGISFQNLEYRLAPLRLIFTSDDGTSGVVQIINNAKTKMVPEIVAFRDDTPDVYKITRDSPLQEDLHLTSDPRLNFKEASWANYRSSGGTTADIPTPQTPVDLTSDVGPNWDGSQNMPVGAEWYKSEYVTNHFSRLSREGMESIGELGYIWTGKPWQTVNLTADNNASPQDWNLLDYITAGREAGDVALSVLPVKAAATNAAGGLTSSLLASGGFNINTRKLPTFAAVMSNAPDIAPNFANSVLGTPSASQPSAYGEIAALAAAAPGSVSGGASTKFAREAAQRALANVAVNHSRVFTVHSAGEYRLGDSVSRAQLETDIFVGVDPATGSAMIQVIDQRFR